jgi:hypothetical protein
VMGRLMGVEIGGGWRGGRCGPNQRRTSCPKSQCPSRHWAEGKSHVQIARFNRSVFSQGKQFFQHRCGHKYRQFAFSTTLKGTEVDVDTLMHMHDGLSIVPAI